MAHASEKSVLADFNGTSFDYFGVHSRFYRKNGKYFVETDGPDGKLTEFETKYTFGVDPLQQYLIVVGPRTPLACYAPWITGGTKPWQPSTVANCYRQCCWRQ